MRGFSKSVRSSVTVSIVMPPSIRFNSNGRRVQKRCNARTEEGFPFHLSKPRSPLGYDGAPIHTLHHKCITSLPCISLATTEVSGVPCVVINACPPFFFILSHPHFLSSAVSLFVTLFLLWPPSPPPLHPPLPIGRGSSTRPNCGGKSPRTCPSLWSWT